MRFFRRVRADQYMWDGIHRVQLAVLGLSFCPFYSNGFSYLILSKYPYVQSIPFPKNHIIKQTIDIKCRIQQTIDINERKIYTTNMKMEEKILQGIICKIQKKALFFRKMAGILAGLMIFEGIVYVSDWMLVSGDEWTRDLWHHYYEDTGKIDNIYLGSSHVFCDLDPTILDQLSGQYNFNLATPLQPLNASYYLLREADRINKLSHVYLELYYDCSYSDEQLLNYNRNWSNTDYMRFSLNKVSYGLAVGGSEHYINALFPFTRYRTSLGDWNQIKKNVERKRSEERKNYQYKVTHSDGNGIDTYEKQGAGKSTRKYKNSKKLIQQDRILTNYFMGKRNREYLCNIIKYCKEREIPITLFVSPIYDLRLISTVDYDDYTLAIREFAAEQGVPFYDFNLVKEEYLPIQDGKNFRDSQHLNQYGAEKFTRFFYQVVNGEEADNEKYFCDSYEERLRKSTPAVLGIYEEQLEEQLEEPPENRTLWVASNRGMEMEYQITLTPDGKRRRQIQDFQDNMKFQVPAEEHGICTIAARVKETPVEMRTMSVRY